MKVHQYGKAEQNQSTYGAVISANTHMHSPLHKLRYLPIYIALDLYIRVNENSLAYKLHISPVSYTLKHAISC